jgi:flagellar basal body-associated protein FliL
MKKIIIIIAAVVILGAGGAAFFILTGGEPQEEPEIRVNHQVGEFITNLRDTRRNLRMNITFVMNTDSDDVHNMLITESARIRNDIIILLRDMTEEDVDARNSMVMLGNRIVTEINSVLGIDNLVEVLFTDFIMA